MSNNINNTIVAISTPLSSGAISIVRMSGNNAIEIADKVFESKKQLTLGQNIAPFFLFAMFVYKNKNKVCVFL